MAQTNPASNIYLDQSKRGHLLVVTDEAATTMNKVITVPAGKIWDLLAVRVAVVASADVGNRQLLFELREADYDVFHSIPALNVQVASATEYYHGQIGAGGGPTEDVATYHFLPLPGWVVLTEGMSFRVSDSAAIQDGTQSQGKLTIAEPVTAGDTLVINGITLTFVAALTAATATTAQVLIGASEAATKTNLNAAIGATPQASSTLHNVTVAQRITMGCIGTDFAGDDMILTAVAAGSAGDAITTTETFTHASNILDAGTLGTETAGVNAADASDVQMQVLEYSDDA